MSGTGRSETKQYRIDRLSVPLALGIICIILAVGLAFEATYVSTHNHSDSEYATLQGQVNQMSGEINATGYVVIVNQTVTIGNNYTAWHFLAPFTGSVLIEVDPPYYGVYARVIWSTQISFVGDPYVAFSYDHNATFNDYDQPPRYGYPYNSFPVVVLRDYPHDNYFNNGTDVEVRVGGINLTTSYSENIIIYYY